MKTTLDKRLSLTKFFITHLKNGRGQIALFFVFVFQVFFILLGMTINITLVVQDKINLQNSLDLATYYGASKQAETLNAMAHINYQMRQNYKLLAWRYRILGSLTLIATSAPSAPYWCPANRAVAGAGSTAGCAPTATCRSSNYPNYCDQAYPICMTADVWSTGTPARENICLNNGVSVGTIPPYPLIAVFNPVNIVHQQRQQQVKDSIEKVCNKNQGLNKIIAHLFLSQFRLDQKDRKIMLRALYDSTLKSGFDLNGESIEAGARKVFEKNLNYNNRSNYEKQKGSLEFYNSVKEKSFKELFRSINILPILFYLELDGTCSGKPQLLITGAGTSSDLTSHPILQRNRGLIPFFNLNYQGGISARDDDFLQTLTLGYHKNENPIVYYGARMSLRSPDTIIQLFDPQPAEQKKFQISAFAKAFGGRFGPNEEADPILKPQILAGNSITIKSYSMQPNYSRYPGDTWGLIDKELHSTNPFLKKTESKLTSNNPYEIDYLIALASNDALSRPLNPAKEVIHDHFLRIMEMTAVFPDLYDLAYYSISPAYMENYFLKICKLLATNSSLCDSYSTGAEIRISQAKIANNQHAYIRGDFGYPYNKRYQAINRGGRAKISASSWPWFFLNDKNPVNPSNLNNMSQADFRELSSLNMRYDYLVKDPAHFLNAWAPTTNRERYTNYDFPTDTFAQCYKTTDKNPSACIQGGRTGYSVKMLSCNLVQTFSEKPDTFNLHYCP